MATLAKIEGKTLGGGIMMTTTPTVKEHPLFREELNCWNLSHEMPTLTLTGRRTARFDDFLDASDRRGVPLVTCRPDVMPGDRWTVSVFNHRDGLELSPEHQAAIRRELEATGLDAGLFDDGAIFEDMPVEEACRLLTALHRATGDLLADV
jgi:hypothetical protein